MQRAEDSLKSPNSSSPFLDNKTKLNDQFKMIRIPDMTIEGNIFYLVADLILPSH